MTDKSNYKTVALRPKTYEKLQTACRQEFGTTSIAYDAAINQFLDATLEEDE